MPKYVNADLWQNLPDDLPYKSSVKRVLIQAPAEDVVPRSEVALEIIEEIEERIAAHCFTSKSDDYADGMYDAVAWVDSKLDELKKKYEEKE